MGRETKPIPRDMPDQQAGSDRDAGEPAADAPRPAEAEQRDPRKSDAPGPDPEVPDTDKAGTGRRGSPHSGSPRPEQPVPDEPSV
ncbi:hypothetical protein [Streptomyces sp. NPDC001642]|uniref:hypothetical protein n=1 Tax=Streptomyces sp. NPDC001642 TaxID=3154392 RepID=UPI0033202F70